MQQLMFFTCLQVLLQLLQLQCTISIITKHYQTIKYFYKHKVPIKRIETIRRVKRFPRLHHSDDIVEFYNCYELTGLYPQLVSLLFEICCKEMKKPRLRATIKSTKKSKVKMTPWNRLLLVLSWIKSGVSLRQLARQWEASSMFCFKELRHIIPILLEKVRVIRLFDEKFLALFPRSIQNVEVHGAVDCTHRRNRIHPGQSKYYRGDKNYHFIASQVTVGFSGMYAHVFLALGHNNDQVNS